jgi:bifunctional non-homologous end joining protein LigD
MVGGRPSPFPSFIEPCLPTLRTSVPDSDQWLYEFKFDGYRAQVHKTGSKVRIFTRRGYDWSEQFWPIAADVANIAAREVVIDGEVVAIKDEKVSFSALIEDVGAKRVNRLAFYAFDILYLDGSDLRDVPLEQRKQLLADLLHESNCDRLFYCEHFDADGPGLFNRFCEMGLE